MSKTDEVEVAQDHTELCNEVNDLLGVFRDDSHVVRTIVAVEARRALRRAVDELRTKGELIMPDGAEEKITRELVFGLVFDSKADALLSLNDPEDAFWLRMPRHLDSKPVTDCTVCEAPVTAQ